MSSARRTRTSHRTGLLGASAADVGAGQASPAFGAPLTRNSVDERSGAGLGTQPSAVTFDETWRVDRLASASTVADLRYQVKCRCFADTSARTRF